jgi:hypothetical protein
LSGQFLTEDNDGKIYYLNARTLDVLEPETGKVRYFTIADGLSGTGNGVAFRDGRELFGSGRIEESRVLRRRRKKLKLRRPSLSVVCERAAKISRSARSAKPKLTK